VRPHLIPAKDYAQLRDHPPTFELMPLQQYHRSFSASDASENMSRQGELVGIPEDPLVSRTQ
jgi:hypothetical protein